MVHRYFSLALFLLLVVAAAFAGSAYEAGEWYYVTMNRPFFSPPGWLYATAWALVYALMALAAWKVWQTEHVSRVGVLTWWVLLLVLNTGWAVLFFNWHRIGWALPLIGLALALSIFCMRAFRPLSREAAWLMTPYLLWAGYLGTFNAAAWLMNGGLSSRFMG